MEKTYLQADSNQRLQERMLIQTIRWLDETEPEWDLYQEIINRIKAGNNEHFQIPECVQEEMKRGLKQGILKY